MLELVLLVALTGVLASVAAVLRLMEVTITVIHPFTIFMLQQSGKIIIVSVNMKSRNTTFRTHYVTTRRSNSYLVSFGDNTTM